MNAVLNKAVCAAEVGPDSAANGLRVEGFPAVIAQHGKRPECDFVFIAEPVRILRGKVPLYAAPDAVAFGAHPDRLGHFNHATAHDNHVAVKAQDALIGEDADGQQHQQKQVAGHSTEPSFTNCFFWDNYSDGDGGAIYADGSISTFTNCTIVKNEADGLGGGIYTLFSAVQTQTTINNSILWENTHSETDNASSEIYDFAFDGAESTVNSSCVDGNVGSLEGDDNIEDDPEFAEQASAAEIGAALRFTRRAADSELAFALDLSRRLPVVGAARVLPGCHWIAPSKPRRRPPSPRSCARRGCSRF